MGKSIEGSRHNPGVGMMPEVVETKILDACPTHRSSRIFLEQKKAGRIQNRVTLPLSCPLKQL